MNKAKTEIAEYTESKLDKQKYLATEKAIAKMDKYSRQEVQDNDWLKREVSDSRVDGWLKREVSDSRVDGWFKREVSDSQVDDWFKRKVRDARVAASTSRVDVVKQSQYLCRSRAQYSIQVSACFMS